MRPDHQERGTPARRPSGRSTDVSPRFITPASLPVLGSGPDGFRRAIETPGGPVPLKGLAVATTTQEGHVLAAAPSAPLLGRIAAPARDRTVRLRPGGPPVRSAPQSSPTRRGALDLGRRLPPGQLAAAICLGAATLAAASALSFEAGFKFDGAARFSGTLAPLALVILAWRLLASDLDRDLKKGSDS